MRPKCDPPAMQRIPSRRERHSHFVARAVVVVMLCGAGRNITAALDDFAAGHAGDRPFAMFAVAALAIWWSWGRIRGD